jgi:hypothetical protein
VPVRRVQFTIRSLMIAVLVVACALALLKKWPEVLAVLVLLGLPLYGLSVLFRKIPRQRSARRFGMSVVMLSLIMLGTGWLSARSLIWFVQWQYGSSTRYGMFGGAGNYAPLCLAIPAGLTAFGLFLNIVVLADICVSLRKFGLLPLVAAFAFVLAVSWIALFGWLNLERFL